MSGHKNIVIIHYNTPLLTECLVKSINKFVKDAVIYIFDNSDKYPFTAKFPNVKILDNTKGQLINFNKWLEKYKDKGKSHGRVNKWGSAKHCYSVEKCMELLNENFVLLDSDILLKRDISNLFIDSSIFVGEIKNQPRSMIRRVVPFICFINVNMCKNNKVHYFDDNYMHGLRKTIASDSYDTGAGFFINASKYKHTEIKCDNYVVHYGHGSWDKKGDKKVLSPEEWIKANRMYWKTEQNKKVVYTCVTGGYDNIIDPKFINDDFDYICFTDNLSLRSDIWTIKPLPVETEGLSQVKKQRYVKINAHKILKNYTLSIWVDGNVTIKGDLNTLIKKCGANGNKCSVFVPKHPQRQCIYDEANVVLLMKKDKPENVKPQMERYKKEGFPTKYGLLQSNIMIRRHNDEKCIRLMECWYNELKNGSHRDQLSFNYACWKNQDVDVVYMDKHIYKSQWFNWSGAHAKRKQIAQQSTTMRTRPISHPTKRIMKPNATEMSNALSLY